MNTYVSDIISGYLNDDYEFLDEVLLNASSDLFTSRFDNGDLFWRKGYLTLLELSSYILYDLYTEYNYRHLVNDYIGINNLYLEDIMYSVSLDFLDMYDLNTKSIKDFSYIDLLSLLTLNEDGFTSIDVFKTIVQSTMVFPKTKIRQRILELYSKLCELTVSDIGFSNLYQSFSLDIFEYICEDLNIDIYDMNFESINDCLYLADEYKSRKLIHNIVSYRLDSLSILPEVTELLSIQSVYIMSDLLYQYTDYLGIDEDKITKQHIISFISYLNDDQEPQLNDFVINTVILGLYYCLYVLEDSNSIYYSMSDLSLLSLEFYYYLYFNNNCIDDDDFRLFLNDFNFSLSFLKLNYYNILFLAFIEYVQLNESNIKSPEVVSFFLKNLPGVSEYII